MEAVGIPEQVGISPVAFERLIRGEVPEAVADKIGGTNAAALQRFVDGGTSLGLAARLKCSEAGVQQLRETIGRQGAIGLLIGLCVGGLFLPNDPVRRQLGN